LPGRSHGIDCRCAAEFWRYDIVDDSWETLEDIPGTVIQGGSSTASRVLR